MLTRTAYAIVGVANTLREVADHIEAADHLVTCTAVDRTLVVSLSPDARPLAFRLSRAISLVASVLEFVPHRYLSFRLRHELDAVPAVANR